MITIQQQQAYYDQYWKGVEFPVNNLRLERAIYILENVLRIDCRNPRIVDLGCGAGWLASMLGHIGPTLGVELSQAAVEEASRRHPHAQFIQADLMDWPPPAESFDIVVSQEVIEHVEDQAAYLAVCHSLLRPGGHLILTTPNARTFNAMPGEQRSQWATQPIENWVTASELRALLRPSFEIVHLDSLIPKYGRKGIYRFWGSSTLRKLLACLGLFRPFQALRLRLGYGLHLAAVARRKP